MVVMRGGGANPRHAALPRELNRDGTETREAEDRFLLAFFPPESNRRFLLCKEELYLNEGTLTCYTVCTCAHRHFVLPQSHRRWTCTQTCSAFIHALCRPLAVWRMSCMSITTSTDNKTPKRIALELLLPFHTYLLFLF